jgi:two-component system, cell cycle response regulator
MTTADSSMRTPLGRALRVAVCVVLFGGSAVLILHDWLGVGGSNLDSFLNGPLYDAVVVSAGLACVFKASDSGRERTAWLAIAAAVMCWGAAEIYWTAFLVDDPSPPYPSPADIGYLAFYPLAIAGLWLLVRTRARELDWRLWMDGAIAALGTAALGTAIVFEYVADRTTGTGLQVATTLAYPLGDILMLSLVVGIVALTRWRPGRTWLLLLLGLSALVIADVAYSLQTTGGLPEGAWIEPIYLLGALCLGAEAWQPRAATIQRAARFDGWRELMVPGFFTVVITGLLVIQFSRTGNFLTAALTGLTMLAVIVRLAISVRENKRLMEAVRTDHLTGLGNQGGLHVDLEALCSRADEEPATLLLLDLNGFKRYNDTFGHPAGDEILTQMADQLRAAVGAGGSAYRVGGDEFAVLIHGTRERREAIVKQAAEALTAKGPNFELSASWGAVSIPEDAAAPREAMQLVDVRMYAQKESRRVSQVESLDSIDGVAQVAGPSGHPRDGEAVEQGN